VRVAEAVVDHAYGRPSGAVGVAMSPNTYDAAGGGFTRTRVRESSRSMNFASPGSFL
jgi:hypothetical protein